MTGYSKSIIIIYNNIYCPLLSYYPINNKKKALPRLWVHEKLVESVVLPESVPVAGNP